MQQLTDKELSLMLTLLNDKAKELITFNKTVELKGLNVVLNKLENVFQGGTAKDTYILIRKIETKSDEPTS